jgi:LysR family transcriptional regulator, hydrogen peroxide-inducible genes activator
MGSSCYPKGTMMNTRLLEYLTAIVKTGSFRGAADYCGVSQPALSIQIKKLENLLGTPLIERQNKELILTTAGKEAVRRSNIIIKEINELKSSIKLTADPYSGDMSIGAFPTLSPYMFPRIANDLRDTYLRINFSLLEEKTDTLINLLEKGELDAAFIAAPFEHKDIEGEFIYEENFLLAVPADHQYANYKSVSLEKVHQAKIMLLQEGHCLRDQALQVCSSEFQKDETFKASSLTTLIQMVRLGNGVTLIPECAAQEIEGVRYLTISDAKPNRKIGLYWRKSSMRKDILLEIADDVKKCWQT